MIQCLAVIDMFCIEFVVESDKSFIAVEMSRAFVMMAVFRLWCGVESDLLCSDLLNLSGRAFGSVN